MKFTVSSLSLLKHLNTMLGVLSSRNTLPILDNFLFDLKGSQLVVTVSDLETIITATIPVEAKSDGAIAIPARRLMKMLRILPKQDLAIEVDKGHRIRIKCEQGHYVICGRDAGQFPDTQPVENATNFSIPASVLRKGISRTLWACGNDELRPVMSGVFFEMTDKHTRLVSTDAHRLVMHTCPPLDHKVTGNFIAPKKTNRALLKYLVGASGDVAVAFNETRASFTLDNVVVHCRVIDGKYPKYEAFIPSSPTRELTIERLLLIGSIRRMEVFANRHTHQVKFVIDSSGMTLSAEDLDDESKANERIDCPVKGDPLTIGFNANFMLDILRNMSSEQVVVQCTAPKKAATILEHNGQGDDSTLFLLMPVMLND
jgi:DNA polymerase III subunit beta